MRQTLPARAPGYNPPCPETHPGLDIALADDLSIGNWDDESQRDAEGHWVVPPFTSSAAMDFIDAQLEPLLVKLQGLRALKTGPWHVRWGLNRPAQALAATRRSFKTYLQARAWARKQRPRLTSKTEWCALVKAQGVPKDIPTDPRSHYGEQFEGWGTFLGTGVVANQCRNMSPYEEVKRWVQEQSPVIHSRQEYQRRRRASKRTDLPSNPAHIYGSKFEGWPTFLGVRRMGSTSMIERMLKQELASFLPVDPQATTRLTGSHGKALQVDIHIPAWNLVVEYDGARFHGGKEDQDRLKTARLCQANPGLRLLRIREAPLRPLSADDLVVKPSLDPLALGQLVVAHLLEVGAILTGFRRGARAYLRRKSLAGDAIVGARWQTHEQARTWARAQALTTQRQWRERAKVPGFLPADIPVSPSLVYGRQFRGWSDFLGAPIVATWARKFWPYDRVQAWARRRGITTGKQWLALSASGRLPKALPSNPNATYKAQWRGWCEFLGTGKPKDEPWAGFDEIKAWCGGQQPPVRSFGEWEAVKEAPGFPQHFPKSLHYHFGAGVFSRLRESMPLTLLAQSG